MMTFENYDQAVLFSDLGSCFEPECNLSDTRENGKWGVVTYETARVKGSLLVAMGSSKPGQVSMNPRLKGWYAIFLGIPASYAESDLNNWLEMKLTSDPAYRKIAGRFWYGKIDEVFWRCAEMTDESVILHKYGCGRPKVSSLAWIRFVPLTEAEAACYQAEEARQDTKRLYACYDMHDTFYHDGDDVHKSPLDYVYAVDHSDAEWVALEDQSHCDGEPLCGDVDNQQYGHEGYLYVQQCLQKNKHPEQMIPQMIAYARQKGLKTCISHRMGHWVNQFPLDAGLFRSSVFMNNKHLRIEDRDGHMIDQLSYAYPEVQEIMTGFILDSVKRYHPDAVQMMFNRGPVFLLFEEPVRQRFARKYPGVDMRRLAVEDERVLDVHCEIMTEFVRKVRAALDQYCAENDLPRVQLHARGHCSLYDSRMRGLDLETWAKEGLIDVVLSYPRRIHEVLPDEVWADAEHNEIDLEKFSRYARELNDGDKTTVWWSDDKPFYPPRPDHKGVMRGPQTLQQAIAEYAALEKYGVTYYYDLLPRSMEPAEFKRRALEAYHAGATHFSLWDTNARTVLLREWAMASRLGHLEELEEIDPEGVEFGHTQRILNAGGIDFSRYNPAIGG